MISVTMEYKDTPDTKLTTWVDGPHAAAGIVVDALLDNTHEAALITVDPDSKMPDPEAR